MKAPLPRAQICARIVGARLRGQGALNESSVALRLFFARLLAALAVLLRQFVRHPRCFGVVLLRRSFGAVLLREFVRRPVVSA